MILLNRTLCLLGVLLLAAQSSAQIPAQPGRNPNTIPPPGAGGPANRPIQRPGVVPGNPARPGAAVPANPGAPGAEKQAIKVDDAITEEGVELQFPNTPIADILLLYEDLTGLKIIRDANAEQATVSVETTGVLPKDKAIMFIEKSLLLNGYAFTPAGEGMVKILAFDAKKPTMEGAPLIDSAMELPMTDQVVSHVVNLKYLNSEDATKAIDQVIPRHSYGVITPVPNAKALVITENSNTIRSILELLERLDNKPSETIQKTFQITRSDVDEVKEALDEILGNEEKGGSGSGRVPNIPQNNTGGAPVQAQQPNIPMNPGAGISGGTASEAAPAKIISIPRRNCLLVIGTAEQVDYLGKLIEELDAASELRNFASRQLKYLAVESAMQIISDAITRTEGDGEGGSSGGAGGTGTNNQNTQNRSNQNNNSNSLFGNNNSNSLGSNGMNNGFGSSGGLGGGGSIGGGGGNLTPLRQNNGPTSMLVGKTLLISDPVANSIFASGPPEHLRILNEIMDELDHRPQQIMISALIGNYQTSEGRGFSLEAALRGRRSSGGGGFFGQAGSSSGLPGTSTTTGTGTTTTSFDPRDALSAAAAFASGNGLTFIGGVHQGLDLIVETLESDSKFKVISRPSVFTQNNTPATLTSGSSFPIASSTQSSLQNGINNNSFLSNVQYQDIVLSLNIIPLINSEDELTLQISQQNSERAGNTVIAGNNYPIITKQELNTIVACRNNSTVLLGGLVRTDDTKTRTGTPIISLIPGLNKVFGSRARAVSNSELLIFIQPRIVRGMDDLPPSIYDSPGSSPDAEDARAAMNIERLNQAEARIPVAKPKLSQRLKSMLDRILVND